MKALSIGRDQGCDIVINDTTDVISRRHAILNISSSGKITIVDQSRNGTYVNGIRITPNVPVPITRKDIISFAHVAKLDWNAVPATNSVMRYSLIAGITVIIIACVWFAYSYLSNNQNDGKDLQPAAIVTDTVSKKDTADTMKKKEQEKKDTIVIISKPNPKPDTKPDTKKPKPEPKDTVKNNRPIG